MFQNSHSSPFLQYRRCEVGDCVLPRKGSSLFCGDVYLFLRGPDHQYPMLWFRRHFSTRVRPKLNLGRHIERNVLDYWYEAHPARCDARASGGILDCKDKRFHDRKSVRRYSEGRKRECQSSPGPVVCHEQNSRMLTSSTFCL